MFFFFKQKTAYEMRISDWSSDVCSSDLFEMGPVPGITPKEIKKYNRYIADWRLGQLGFKPIYMIDEHPLPWLAPLLNGVEHANFFEQIGRASCRDRVCQYV